MDYPYLERLRQHAAWRLLNAESASFILSFFHAAFIKPNARSISETILTAKLEEHRLALGETIAGKYPRPAREYLDDWARKENAYLRKYYPARGDEPEFELTPASEKAVEWARSLQQRAFVGTESRLLGIFNLMRELVQATETDDTARMAFLEKQKAGVEAEIAKVREGRGVQFDSTRIKERYFQIADAARALLSDFRQIEENFRELDRRTREKTATSDKGKGLILDEIFGEEDTITSSDQGKSFKAFWEFLMSQARQEEIQELTEKILSLKEIKGLPLDDLVPRLKYRLLESGEKVKENLASLVENLRRFLDDQAWLENRRIMELIHAIEKRGVASRQDPPTDASFALLPGVRPELDLTMARGIFIPARKDALEDVEITDGNADFESDALYNVHYVDESVLCGRIRELLEGASQVTLVEVCARFPLEKGLSELLAYLNLASKDAGAIIEEASRQSIEWFDKSGKAKRAVMPRVIFTTERSQLHETA